MFFFVLQLNCESNFVSILIINIEAIERNCQTSCIFYMSSKEASTENSIDLLSEVSSMNDGFYLDEYRICEFRRESLEIRQYILLTIPRRRISASPSPILARLFTFSIIKADDTYA